MYVEEHTCSFRICSTLQHDKLELKCSLNSRRRLSVQYHIGIATIQNTGINLTYRVLNLYVWNTSVSLFHFASALDSCSPSHLRNPYV